VDKVELVVDLVLLVAVVVLDGMVEVAVEDRFLLTPMVVEVAVQVPIFILVLLVVQQQVLVELMQQLTPVLTMFLVGQKVDTIQELVQQIDILDGLTQCGVHLALLPLY
tara:strand:- start:77 stop:403 length:327 start_codon:yes stop_codon:yes gene_type:complete